MGPSEKKKKNQKKKISNLLFKNVLHIFQNKLCFCRLKYLYWLYVYIVSECGLIDLDSYRYKIIYKI